MSPLRGGGGLRTLGTSKAFRDKGCDVELLAPSDRIDIEGIPVKPLHGLTKSSSQLFSSFIFVFQLFFALLDRINNVKLIFIHNSVAAIPSIIISKLYRVPAVLDVTDISTEYLYASESGSLQKALIRVLLFIEYMTFKLADRVIVVSNEMAQHLVRKGVTKKKIEVVYDGAEIDKLQAVKKTDKAFNCSVIHHGGIDLRDGVADIVDAARILVEEFPDAKFYIVGDGSCLADVIKQAKEKGVHDAFVFTGWQPYSKMREYLAEADIGVVSRINILPNNMVLTLKLLEYWATETAVISSDMKGIREVATDHEDILFYEPENPFDLAKKLRILFTDQQLLNKIRKNGLKTAADFDWPNLTSKIAELSLLFQASGERIT